MPDTAVRLYPLPSHEIPAAEIYQDLELPPPERYDASRPYVIVNMVSSVDGSVTLKGKASGIGSETDRRAMRTLRSTADAVMIGAGTLRSERLSLGLDEPGGESQPLAVIVTRSGNLPLDANLILAEHQNLLVITTPDGPESVDGRLRERARVVRVAATASGGANLKETLGILKAEFAVDRLLVEGGPTLNHRLFSQNLADELFLTLTPKLLGGGQASVLTLLEGCEFSPSEISGLELLGVHLCGSELYLRYRLAWC